jgi:hypothetical protein
MEATEVTEKIREAVAEEKAGHAAVDQFRTRAAIIIGVLAALLAVSTVAGDNAAEDMVNNNIRASDTWAFYQAKNVRQTSIRLAADEMETAMLIYGGTMSDEARQDIDRKIARYRSTADRYESEPDEKDPTNPLKGEGKKELMAQARNYERQREHAERQDRYFDYATGLFQIALVLGSVSIVAVSRPLLIVTLILGAVAVILSVNGFFLLVEVPFLEGGHANAPEQ